MPETTFDISSLLGKEIDSPQSKSVFETLDPATKTKLTRERDELRWTSKKAGAEVRAEPKSKRVTDIFLFAGGDGFKRYPGSMPYGITFEMKQPAAKSCVPGTPIRSDSEGNCWDEEDRRIILSYDPAGNMNNVYLTTDF
jgi:hypothetical protein